jgi:23S rRNA (cytidine1920-2'-O)/16S rRNA (cytidine1409-2'-O)-methyltransferase
LLKEPGEIIALVKPQFELPKPLLDAGRGQKKKGGVVRDQHLRDAAVQDIADFAIGLGLQVAGIVPSVLTGPAGNQEYFIYLKKMI